MIRELLLILLIWVIAGGLFPLWVSAIAWLYPRIVGRPGYQPRAVGFEPNRPPVKP